MTFDWGEPRSVGDHVEAEREAILRLLSKPMSTPAIRPHLSRELSTGALLAVLAHMERAGDLARIGEDRRRARFLWVRKDIADGYPPVVLGLSTRERALLARFPADRTLVGEEWYDAGFSNHRHEAIRLGGIGLMAVEIVADRRSGGSSFRLTDQGVEVAALVRSWQTPVGD